MYLVERSKGITMKKGKCTKFLAGILCAAVVLADLGSAGLLSLAAEAESVQETEEQVEIDESVGSVLETEASVESIQVQSTERLENDTETENQTQKESVSEIVEIAEMVETETAAEDISESEVEEVETQAVLDADGNIASGAIDEDYGHITWVIDANGKLTVEGTGDFSKHQYSYTDYYYPECAPWYPYRESIKSTKVNVTKMIDTSFMFTGERR